MEDQDVEHPDMEIKEEQKGGQGSRPEEIVYEDQQQSRVESHAPFSPEHPFATAANRNAFDGNSTPLVIEASTVPQAFLPLTTQTAL